MEQIKIEIEREDDGRWIAEVHELPGVMAYGGRREEAVARVEALALRVIADRLEHGETIPEIRASLVLSVISGFLWLYDLPHFDKPDANSAGAFNHQIEAD